MEPLRLDPVPARVLAWHNRHPLARRIAPAHIGSMGYVALPFVQRPGKRGLRRGFDEPFLDGERLGPLARWAARHGVPCPEPPTDGPLREVKKSGERFEPGDTAVTLYVRTAFIDDGWQAGRVLVGAGEPAPVFGRRLRSRPRTGLAAGLLAALAAAAWFTLAPPAATDDALVVAAPAASAVGAASAASATGAVGAASAASAATTVAAVEPPASAPANDRHAAPAPVSHAVQAHATPPAPAVPVPPPAAAESPAPAPAQAHAPAPAPAGPTRPPDVEPRWGRIDLPSLRPSLQVVEPVVRPLAPAASAAEQPVWALATRAFRREADSEQTTVAIGALLQRAGLRAQRVQVVDIGGSWHVVVYPFANRVAADNARHLLAARGFATEPVEF